MNESATELVNISIGELWDKYSILLIKKERVKNKDKLENVNQELELLNKNMQKYNYNNDDMFINLKNINERLWDIEDTIRLKEFNKEFDEVFIQLARSVYINNDERAECKKKINLFFGSFIKEVKDYVNYCHN